MPNDFDMKQHYKSFDGLAYLVDYLRDYVAEFGGDPIEDVLIYEDGGYWELTIYYREDS
jgi:hypothetical protein